MATLQRLSDQQPLIVQTNHTIGRDSANYTVINRPQISRHHAVILWDGDRWRLKDTSTNGTYINDQRAPSGQFVDLNEGEHLRFGLESEDTYRIENLKAPTTCLIPVTPHSPVIDLHDVVILPVEEKEITIYLSENSQWTCQTYDHSFVLNNGDLVGSDSQQWRFMDAYASQATAIVESTPKDDIVFVFDVSQNEEHVSLTLAINQDKFDLGERNHHYLLLVLAKKRLEDKNNDMRDQDQGWIDKDLLSKMLGQVEQHINVQIHRFRKHVTATLPNNNTLHQIIERRPGEVRFAYNSIEIHGGLPAEQAPIQNNGH